MCAGDPGKRHFLGRFSFYTKGNFEMSWFVVTVRQQSLKLKEGQKECIAFDNLKDASFEVYQPRYREHYFKGRHRRYRSVFLFGRYIFVEFNARWNQVLDVTGVLQCDQAAFQYA
jgi:hypothetical protein